MDDERRSNDYESESEGRKPRWKRYAKNVGDCLGFVWEVWKWLPEEPKQRVRGAVAEAGKCLEQFRSDAGDYFSLLLVGVAQIIPDDATVGIVALAVALFVVGLVVGRVG